MSASPDSLSATTPPAKREAWERWVKIWNGVFYLSLAIPTLFALLADNGIYPKWLLLGLSLALGIWYGLIMVWLVPRAGGRWQTTLSLVFLIGAITLWFPLARSHWGYFLTASSFFGLMWGTLPFWMAAVGNVILIGILIWIQALNLGRSLSLSWNIVLIGAVVLGWTVLLALWVRTIMMESKERKQLIEQLEAAQNDLAVAERQSGVLQERQRMAQEIHDTLAQGFTSIVMQLEAAEQALPEGLTSVQSRIHKARDTARDSLAEARRLVLALRPESLEESTLPDALRREARRWADNTGIKTDFAVTGDSVPLHPEAEVSLLRAMQEGLSNVHKHAQAREVSVTLSFMADQVALDVHDDGQGFDPHNETSSSDQGGGFGLQVMRQRVGQIGGEVLVESSPEQGTTLVVQIPIVNEDPQDNQDP